MALSVSSRSRLNTRRIGGLLLGSAKQDNPKALVASALPARPGYILGTALAGFFSAIFLSCAMHATPAAAQQLRGTPGAATAIEFPNSRVLPQPPAPFAGTISPSARDSTPAWPPTLGAPEGAPNVLLIITDDVGFGAPSTFGGVIPTPTLDNVAEAGLRYTQFHTTALCSPTRASLLTGRNPHSVGFGMIAL